MDTTPENNTNPLPEPEASRGCHLLQVQLPTLKEGGGGGGEGVFLDVVGPTLKEGEGEGEEELLGVVEPTLKEGGGGGEEEFLGVVVPTLKGEGKEGVYLGVVVPTLKGRGIPWCSGTYSQGGREPLGGRVSTLRGGRRKGG